MKFLFLALCLLGIVSLANAGEPQKQEGQCGGKLEDGSEISFSYFSNYNGCQTNIAGSIHFSPESDLESRKGKRSFTDQKDIYSFRSGHRILKSEVYRLTFANSTGNTSGVFDYFDAQGAKQSVTVQCLIHDYEYDDCR